MISVSLNKTVVSLFLRKYNYRIRNLKANNNGKILYGAISNIVASKAATLALLTKPKVQYHLQKLNQAGKATISLLVQLPATSYDTK